MYWYVFFLTFAACVLRGSLSGRVSRSEKPLALALKSFSARVVRFLLGNQDVRKESNDDG